MSYGISCTNEFDEAQALNYLKTWIQHHPLYAEIPVHENKDLKEDILEAFHVAASINMQDPDVFQALGVLHYLTGEFEQAEENFRAALMLKQAMPHCGIDWEPHSPSRRRPRRPLSATTRP